MFIWGSKNLQFTLKSRSSQFAILQKLGWRSFFRYSSVIFQYFRTKFSGYAGNCHSSLKWKRIVKKKMEKIWCPNLGIKCFMCVQRSTVRGRHMLAAYICTVRLVQMFGEEDFWRSLGGHQPAGYRQTPAVSAANTCPPDNMPFQITWR